MPQNSFLLRCWPGLLLLAASLLVTALTYQDYGVSWDEYVQRGIGEASYNYAFDKGPDLQHFEDKEYGASYEMLLVAIERTAHITDTRDIFLMRHLVNHIFFLLCMFCGYVLALRLFRNRLLASVGFLLMAFHPRIYAHSFFNSKDVPFLGLFLVALLVAHIAFQKDKAWWYALLGVACGLTTSIRILGMLLVGIFCIFILTDIVTAIRGQKKVTRQLVHLAVFTVAACATLYAAWPLLWTDPMGNFCGAFKKLSHFPWEGHILFGGHIYSGKDLPWFYLPGWFAITTPLVWLLAGVAGIITLLVVLIGRPLTFLKNTRERNFLLYALCIFLPVFSVIILHSVVYDDWRHVYFIYPPFILLGLYAIDSIPSKKWRCIAYGACIAQAVCTGVFMARSHPFQQVYFNRLVSHDKEYLRHNYDLEYWGCSFKQGLEYILAHDIAANIKVQQNLLPAKNNQKILPADQRRRILIIPKEFNPGYLITNFRDSTTDLNYPVFYEIRVLNSTIMRVYKLHS